MFPIPPLDGSRIVMGLLPPRLGVSYGRLEPYGIFIIFALLSLPIDLFERVLLPVIFMGAQLLGVSF